MKKTLLALVLTSGFVGPALSQEESEAMICSDFVALNGEEQMEAVATAQMGEQGDPTPPDGEAAKAVLAACTDHPDMRLAEAINEAMGD